MRRTVFRDRAKRSKADGRAFRHRRRRAVPVICQTDVSDAICGAVDAAEPPEEGIEDQVIYTANAGEDDPARLVRPAEPSSSHGLRPTTVTALPTPIAWRRVS
jgi:hypothetical protein